MQKYSPSDSAKLWEKQLTRKSGVRFFPTLCLRSAIEELEADEKGSTAASGGVASSSAERPAQPPSAHAVLSVEGARDLVQEFFEFRKLILSIDPPDEDGLLDAPLNPAVAGSAEASALLAGGEAARQAAALPMEDFASESEDSGPA